MKVDLEQIKSLLDVVGKTDITELTIESGEEKITIKKGFPAGAASIELAPRPVPIQVAVPETQNVSSKAPEPQKVEEENNGKGLIPITSPMVGTFYRAPSPTAPSFVDVGDVISPGQTVCIIEAMKLMNDLPSEVAGRVVRCLVENGTTVEYGQPLFMVNPKV
ncbi:MAG: acetyl-CoA carboxylase biotin carboxyl carrier protein [Candidatus Obscuribacterales bacterium]|nr:acetyl-CoA carboxylase biotin carboxyl carrier protein [Candidatus Obscuribacterales bacterium]